MSRGLTILLPTYNEVDALPKVVNTLPLDTLRAAGWEPRIVVADGRSTDGTQQTAADLNLELIVQGPAAGKGFGMREGFARFLAHHDDVLVMLDADGTYAPDEMLRLLEHLEKGSYDVVIGSRLRGDIQPGAMSRLNWIGNHILTWFAVALYQVFISDVCTGYWAFRRSAIQKMSLNSTEFEIEAEMYTACATEGLRMSEVPISYAPRIGESKLGSIGDGVRILRKLLVRRMFPRPVNRV
ncbi:MAG: glycosyltransferase family 2 protein [Candidatus Poseidoniales archaeon]